MILNRNKHILRSKQNWVGKCHPRGFIVQVTGLVDHHLSLTLATVQVVCIHHVSTPGLTAHYKEVEVRHLGEDFRALVNWWLLCSCLQGQGAAHLNTPPSSRMSPVLISVILMLAASTLGARHRSAPESPLRFWAALSTCHGHTCILDTWPGCSEGRSWHCGHGPSAPSPWSDTPCHWHWTPLGTCCRRHIWTTKL